MRRAVGHLEKERTASVFGDEGHGTIRQLVAQVAVVFSGRRVLPEVGLPVAAHMRVPIDVARQKTPEIVEAVAVGMELGLEAKMPFADEGGRIPLVLQELRQRTSGRREADIEASGRRGGVCLERTLEPQALLVAARDQRRPRGRAHRRVRVELCQPDAFAREPIEIGCLDVRRAVAAQIAIPEVVGDDEHDVRPLLRGGPLGQRRNRDHDERREQQAKAHNGYCFTIVTVTFDGYCFEW